MDSTFMYCRSCGWMNDKEGVGVPQCGGCGRYGAAWVQGTEEELARFRTAIAEDPQAYRRFPTTDYWAPPQDL